MEPYLLMCLRGEGIKKLVAMTLTPFWEFLGFWKIILGVRVYDRGVLFDILGIYRF